MNREIPDREGLIAEIEPDARPDADDLESDLRGHQCSHADQKSPQREGSEEIATLEKIGRGSKKRAVTESKKHRHRLPEAHE